VLLFATFSALGVEYALVIAVIAALAWLIPIVGGLIAVVPVGVIAMLTGPWAAALAIAATLIVFMLLEFVVERRLYKRRRYGSLWAVLIALAMLDVFGLLGLVLAPVVASVAQIVIEEGLRPAPAEVTRPAPMLSALRTRVAEARAELDKIENPSPRTAGLLDRLDGLLEKAEQVS
jgi:predicted PurR-regulated permease PerM